MIEGMRTAVLLQIVSFNMKMMLHCKLRLDVCHVSVLFTVVLFQLAKVIHTMKM